MSLELTVAIDLHALLNASPLGETGWMLSDGNEFWVHNTPLPGLNHPETKLHLGVHELLERVVAASHLELLDTRYGPEVPLLSKDTPTVRKALSGEVFEQTTEVLRFRALDGSVHCITIQALLDSVQESADSWRLPSGIRMSIPADSQDAVVAKALPATEAEEFQRWQSNDDAGWFDVDVYNTRASWDGIHADDCIEYFKNREDAIACANSAKFKGCYQVTVAAYGNHEDLEPGEGVYTRFKHEA